MDIKVINNEFDFLGVIDNFRSLIWYRSFYGIGTVELHLPISYFIPDKKRKERTVKQLKQYTIDGTTNMTVAQLKYVEIITNGIIANGNILINGKHGAIIESIQIQVSDGAEELIVTGKQLKGIFADRIINPPIKNLDDSADSVMETLIKNNCIDATDTKRNFPRLSITSTVQGADDIIYTGSYKTLSDELEDVGRANKIGWDVTVDISDEAFVCKIYSGIDRTAEQNVNSRAIFGEQYNNLLTQEYTDSASGSKNYTLVAGQGEGDARAKAEINTDYTGFDRKELFVDARDVGDTEENPMTDEEIARALTDRGNQKLSECDPVKNFTAQINTNGNLTYGVDYDLGDIVTVQNTRWGITLDAQIEEVREVYEDGKMNIEITFGNNIPTIYKLLNNKIREVAQ